MLVPEIALTPQIVGRFIERFGDTVAVLHSRLTPAERYDEWRRLREGEARVCVGPRSAVFAPIERLGLIVVDEEHDASYKHEGDPRYDARDGRRRARPPTRRALLLLGSATPRPESVLRVPSARACRGASTAGRCRRWRCSTCAGRRTGCTRATAQALAEVRAARRQGDRAAQPPRLVELPLLPLLRARVELSRLRRGARAAPRGGLAGLPPLRPPRAVARALRDVRLDLRRAPRRRHRAPAARARATCSTTAAFPVFRLDADTVAAAAGHGVGRAAARASSRPSRGVLIGTQMVAKGHDFPDVTLGVVLDADATLRFPDFRAEERTFALIAQLAGRVGRGGARARARADDRARGARDRARRRATTATASSPASSSAAERCATRRSRTDQGSSAPRAAAPARARRAGRCATVCASSLRRSGRVHRGRAARPGPAVSPARPRAPGARDQGRRARAPRCAPSARRSPRAARAASTA